MFDIYLIGSGVLSLIIFFMTTATIYYVMRWGLHSGKLWKPIVCGIITLALFTINSAYKPKNTLPQVQTSKYYENRVDTKVVPEKPRVKTFAQQVELIDKQGKKIYEEILPMMGE